MRVEPADAVIVGIVVGALAADVGLERHDRELVSHRLLAKIVVAVLAGHLWHLLPRWADPFAIVGPVAKWLPR